MTAFIHSYSKGAEPKEFTGIHQYKQGLPVIEKKSLNGKLPTRYPGAEINHGEEAGTGDMVSSTPA
ncbi:MAG: hypothetical protein CL681_06590 [Blastopirellula sp.]|nr:hypothetical protein [Blastopirellula sp.]